MGCDGGTIPKRDELVKVKKRPETKDKESVLSFKWKHCAITQDSLKAPIVACGMGRLYNKCSIIEGLLDRSKLPKSAKYIKSLKDIKDLRLTLNPEFKLTANKREGMLDVRASPYICPISKVEMSGKHKFVFLWSCGCVFSERTIREIKTNLCHTCQKLFTAKDIVVLNGSENDLVRMKLHMEERQAMQKNKKKYKYEIELVPITAPIEKQISIQTNKPQTVTAESFSLKIKRTNDFPTEDSTKKLKLEYSVAKDPGVSDVYKSIFTSHKSEQEQTRAHWITYNPFYN